MKPRLPCAPAVTSATRNMHLSKVLNRIEQSKQHSGLCLQQVTAAERFTSSQEKEQLHSGFDQGPLVWHYQLPRAVSRAPALPQAPGYTTCSQSVQMNSFTHDQGGEHDLLTPSGEKGKVYAHKNDIAEHRAAGAKQRCPSKAQQSSAEWALHSEAALQGQHSTHSSPLPGNLSMGQGLGKPTFPSLVFWSGLGVPVQAPLTAGCEHRHFSH